MNPFRSEKKKKGTQHDQMALIKRLNVQEGTTEFPTTNFSKIYHQQNYTVNSPNRKRNQNPYSGDYLIWQLRKKCIPTYQFSLYTQSTLFYTVFLVMQ